VTGFKNFILRGNLVEVAVAFVMAGAFLVVVQATVGVIMGLIGKAGGNPNFDDYTPGGLLIGVWITAVISFIVIGAVVYFLVVKPYTAAKERYFPSEEPGTPEDVALLQEIRDLLAAQTGGSTGGSTGAHAGTPPTA
jgi:large conductance mechanosensitive channel